MCFRALAEHSYTYTCVSVHMCTLYEERSLPTHPACCSWPAWSADLTSTSQKRMNASSWMLSLATSSTLCAGMSFVPRGPCSLHCCMQLRMETARSCTITTLAAAQWTLVRSSSLTVAISGAPTTSGRSRQSELGESTQPPDAPDASVIDKTITSVQSSNRSNTSHWTTSRFCVLCAFVDWKSHPLSCQAQMVYCRHLPVVVCG
jgi:hypothetical protein